MIAAHPDPDVHSATSAGPATCQLLVVEDDATILANLVEYLELQGHQVDVAYDGLAAQNRLAARTYDVVILDLGLPRADGQVVLHHLRNVLGLATPVLVLTARDALASKLDTLALGADDYLVKPYALAEVAMRVQVLHRRARGAVVSDLLQAGSLCLDRRRREARVRDQRLHLMPRSMQILEALLLDPGRVISRRALENLLWPDEDVGTDALRSQIHLLRKALSQAGYDGLETVHGVGYRLKCP
ncbi:MAG: response regulator transcription factor [Sterolibacterium sp.]|nr:response regulator transcription factor [Sterolibacterium sp.]